MERYTKTRDWPWLVRIIINWMRYRRFVNTHPREDIEILLRKTKSLGFNDGVESYCYHISQRDKIKRYRNESLLIAEYGSNKHIKLEDIHKKHIETNPPKKKRFDPSWTPSLEQVLSVKPIYRKESEKVSYTLHDFRDSHNAHVIVLRVQGFEPRILTGEFAVDIMRIANAKYDELNMIIKQENIQSLNKGKGVLKKKTDNIDISHVQRAMGIDRNSKNDDDDDFTYFTDDIFK